MGRRAWLAAMGVAALSAALAWRASPHQASPPDADATALAEGLGPPALIRSNALGLSEPSGIAFHEPLDRLFVVGDRGAVAELDAGGRLRRVRSVEGAHEDVVVHPPTGDLLLVSESDSSLIRFDPRAFVERGRCRLDDEALLGVDAVSPRAGFEAIAFRPDAAEAGGGILSLGHQRDPATIVHLALDPLARCGGTIGGASVVERWRLRHRSLRALTFAAPLGRYLAIDGRRDELLVLGRGGAVDAVLPLPGVQPEGLCFDAHGVLWLADDRRGIWRWSGALVALAAALSGAPAPEPGE